MAKDLFILGDPEGFGKILTASFEGGPGAIASPDASPASSPDATPTAEIK